MKNRIYDAFNEIKAEEALKESTVAFLQKKALNKKRTAFKRFAVACASLMLMLFAGLLSYHLYFTEAAVIDIDVNPSIELTLNRFDRIIAVYAYNEDGMKVVENAEIAHKTYKEALKILIDKMEEMGYIRKAGLFTATLQMLNGAEEGQRLDALKDYISSDLQADGKIMEQDIFSVDSTTKENAQEQNLTPAKYLAILDLQEVDSTATFDGCRGHSINEIREETHAHTNGEHGNSGQGNKHGNGANGHRGGVDGGQDTSSQAASASGSLDENLEASEKAEIHEETEMHEEKNVNPPKSEKHNSENRHNNGKKYGRNH